MTESDFVILKNFGSDLKIQSRISCWLSQISAKYLWVKIHAKIVLATSCKLMIPPLDWVETVILSVLKRRKWVISWSIYYCHISWKRPFFDKKHYIVNRKRFIIEPKYMTFWSNKTFLKAGHGPYWPLFVQVRHKNSNFRVFYHFFSEPLQHNLLILIEYPLSESVKKGKFVTKIFLSDNVEWSSKRNNKE